MPASEVPPLPDTPRQPLSRIRFPDAAFESEALGARLHSLSLAQDSGRRQGAYAWAKLIDRRQLEGASQVGTQLVQMLQPAGTDIPLSSSRGNEERSFAVWPRLVDVALQAPKLDAVIVTARRLDGTCRSPCSLILATFLDFSCAV